MMRLPPEAPKGVRTRILEALKNEDYSIFPDGRSYLERIEFVPEEVVKDVIEDLEAGYRLYQLPNDGRSAVKYQCCLRYDQELVIHVKMRPTAPDEEPHVWIGFHRHNTGYPPLPS